MKAIVFAKYGSPDLLQLKEVEKPVPQDNEVLIKIHASSVNPFDWRTMRAKPFFIRLQEGLLKPKNKRLGADFSGQIEAVGRKAKQFQPGDKVFGICSGAFAEYVCVNEDEIALQPAGATFEEAAALPIAAITALQGLRDKGQLQPGQQVLINGASGGVGTFAVQIAKSFGAEVTGVCSTKKLALVSSIGADHVIDYTKENFTQNGQCYDLIFDAAAYHSLSDYQRALSPQGVYVWIGGSLAMILKIMLSRSKKFTLLSAKKNKKDFNLLKELFETGQVKAVIDRSYPLREVAEAIRYLEAGKARGKVVITVEHNSK
ncbi:MAG: NAD(P)-dependent alcohol dehydrogenase [Halanaerobiales bacterium]|nr:NAD(P)-dependent alcohol dehydrogenase [Halanaerobiales bacterium]